MIDYQPLTLTFQAMLFLYAMLAMVTIVVKLATATHPDSHLRLQVVA